MQPEDIIELLESDNVISRRNGITAYFEFLIPSKDEDSKSDNESAYNHTKLWKTIRRKTWDDGEADEIIIDFFEFIMRRFKTGDKRLSDKELAKEKDAPTIQNLEAFAFWKCKNLLKDYEIKMAKQREREVVTEKAEELGENIAIYEGDNTLKLIEECISIKLMKFGKEVSPDGAEAIAMQIKGVSIKKIADWQKRKIGAQKEFLSASKRKAKSYLEPCNKIGGPYSNAIKKLGKN